MVIMMKNGGKNMSVGMRRCKLEISLLWYVISHSWMSNVEYKIHCISTFFFFKFTVIIILPNINE